MVPSQFATLTIDTNTSTNNHGITANTSTSKTATRRRKIEIKKVEQTNKRHVTFSKRKLGLFNKVTELSILCQAETALIVTSQNGKLYACGYPTPDVVIQRFLFGGSPQKGARAEKRKQKESIEVLRVQYEATQEILSKEKKRLQEAKEVRETSTGTLPPWWQRSINEMGVEELEQFKESLKDLKTNLVGKVDEKALYFSMQQMPHPSMVNPIINPVQKFSNFPLLLNNECTSSSAGINYQAWNDWSNNNNGNASSSHHNSSSVPKFDDFGPY